MLYAIKSNSLKLYLDGKILLNKSDCSWGSDTFQTGGACSFNIGFYPSGLAYSDVRIYKGLLSEAEIITLANSSIPIFNSMRDRRYRSLSPTTFI
jgi:hypothetical protein